MLSAESCPPNAATRQVVARLESPLSLDILNYNRGGGRTGLSRLFISHSSKDEVAAKAFKQWLGAHGWPPEDVFLDVDNINAGARWKDSLRVANARCEAVVLLASPEALSSSECLAEVRIAEDYGKEILVVLLRDLTLEDRRLDSFKDRQIVDLSAAPVDHTEAVQHGGTAHQVRFSGASLEKIRRHLVERGITPNYFPWPPADNLAAEPFPGLSAYSEYDAGIFFGRDADILRGLDKLRSARRKSHPRTLVVQAASGAGKSSFLRAGLWPRISRNPDFLPVALVRPAQGILTGPHGLGRRLSALLSRTDHPVNPGDVQAQLLAASVESADGSLKRYVAEIGTRALARRQVSDEEARMPALVLAVDQAEELFNADDAEESERFIQLMRGLLREPPSGIELFVIFTIRSDSAARLFQLLSDNGLDVPDTLPLLPLPPSSYRDIIQKPLEMLARRGRSLALSPDLVERLVTDSSGADALPLLAFTLSNLYRDFGVAGEIGLEHYDKLGGIAGCIGLAMKRALSRPGDRPAIPSSRPEQLALLRATFIPWLARINPDTGAPMRRVARMAEFSPAQAAIVERLVASRLLVVDQRDGTSVVEIAHESLLRQWHELGGWLEEDAGSLKIIESVEWATGEWLRGGKSADLLDHRTRRLRTAERLVSRKDYRQRLGEQGLDYLRACRRRDRRQSLLFGGIVGGLATIVLGGAAAWWYQAPIVEALYWTTHVRPFVLSAENESDLGPLERFQECADCPQMTVLPIGSFRMGALPGEGESTGREYEDHLVTLGTTLAVSTTPITFEQFTACAANGDCAPQISLNTNDDRPAVNVTWADAQSYAAWLARITGKPYRLLSEAEYEYAARGGMTSRYPWGESAGKGNANCADCNLQKPIGTSPVGSFPANGYGLRDVVGNVFQWVEDCFYPNYSGAPNDGSVWNSEGCTRRVVRGASYLSKSSLLRSSWRDWRESTERNADVGFRIARYIEAPEQ